jgi:hypothetical protein
MLLVSPTCVYEGIVEAVQTRGFGWPHYVYKTPEDPP